jgi:hypothetical protein
VNDDLPEKVPFATGDFVSGDASTSMVAGDAGCVIPTGTPVFSGKRVDDDYDVTIRSFVPAAEVPEEIEVFIDVDDIVSQVYTAIGEDFPYLAELFKVKREEHEVRRNTSITDPLPEGEWDLGEDTAGGDDL